MRKGFGIAAGLLVLIVFGASLSARPAGTSKVQMAPNAVVTGKLPKPTGPQQSIPGGVAQLNPGECHQLGGKSELKPQASAAPAFPAAPSITRGTSTGSACRALLYRPSPGSS